jgi:hypothetical protein
VHQPLPAPLALLPCLCSLPAHTPHDVVAYISRAQARGLLGVLQLGLLFATKAGEERISKPGKAACKSALLPRILLASCGSVCWQGGLKNTDSAEAGVKDQ